MIRIRSWRSPLSRPLSRVPPTDFSVGGAPTPAHNTNVASLRCANQRRATRAIGPHLRRCTGPDVLPDPAEVTSTSANARREQVQMGLSPRPRSPSASVTMRHPRHRARRQSGRRHVPGWRSERQPSVPDDNRRVGYLCTVEFVARSGGRWTHPPDGPERDQTVAIVEGVAAVVIRRLGLGRIAHEFAEDCLWRRRCTQARPPRPDGGPM